MPRRGSIPSDILVLLGNRRDGASIGELVTGLNEARRFPVPPHSVRSALYQHMDGRGEDLFVRVSRGRYAVRRCQDALASAADAAG